MKCHVSLYTCVIGLFLALATQLHASSSSRQPDLADLQKRFGDSMVKLKPVIAKVGKRLNELDLPTDALTADDLTAMRDVAAEAAILLRRLSPEEASEPAAPSDECKFAWKLVQKRGLLGRLRCCWVQVPVESGAKKVYRDSAGSRKPLRDNLAKVGEEIAKRLEPGAAADPRRDRLLAIQLMSILSNLDPVFKAGEFRG